MTTTIQVVGTIATEPKLIHPASGTQLCSFRLASDERRYDKDTHTWIDNGSNWFGVVAFRSLAAHAHESFRKGDRVIVTGRLRMRSWEKDDRRGVSVEIDADALGHDVRWGISRFEKRVNSRGEQSEHLAPKQVGLDQSADVQHVTDQTPADEHAAPESFDGETPQDSPESLGWVAAA